MTPPVPAASRTHLPTTAGIPRRCRLPALMALAALPALASLFLAPHLAAHGWASSAVPWLALLATCPLLLFGWRLAARGAFAAPPPSADRNSRLAWEVERLTEALTQRDQALAQAQERAQAYLDIVGVMVVMLNRNGNLILANRTARAVLGCDAEETCQGSRWFDNFIPETERKTLRAHFNDLMAGTAELAASREGMILTRQGHRRLIAWHNTLLRAPDGRILGTLSAGEDITETRQVQEALRLSEERLRLAQEVARVGTYEWNITSGMITWTPELEALHGLSPGEYGGTLKHWLRLVHPDDLALAHREIDRALQSDGIVDAEWRVIWPDASVHWLAGRGRVIRAADGQALRMIGINIDITERKRLQAQLQQAQKMEALGQLTGGIAHDFNNILASVLGFARLARRLPGPNPRLTEYLDEIIQAGERARDLVVKMLAFGRGQPGREARSLAPLALAKEAMKMLAAAIPASIRVETRFQEDLPDIALEPVAFHQILVNLVINARDAVGDKGKISVSLAACRSKNTECALCHADCTGEFVELSVHDNGPGIPQAILPRIFEPFFSTKEPGKGSGMGLAMVHGLVRGAGGHFRVQSSPGEGTLFNVYLPIAQPGGDTAIQQAPPIPASPASGPKGRVLIIDDEAAILRLLGNALEMAGWQVRAFDHPLQALEAFCQDPTAYAALITDQAMPEMTGSELIQAVHAQRPTLPAILCTGYSERLDEARARQLGASRFFMKPVDSDVLIAALDNLMLVDEPPPSPCPPSP